MTDLDIPLLANLSQLVRILLHRKDLPHSRMEPHGSPIPDAMIPKVLLRQISDLLGRARTFHRRRRLCENGIPALECFYEFEGLFNGLGGIV